MNARCLAADIVFQVVYRQHSLNELFREHQAHPEISFIKALCFNTLRYGLFFNSLLKPHFKKKTKPEIKSYLLIGLGQIFCLDIPDYAAVSETVTAIKSTRFRFASGLVNAILKRVERKPIQNTHPQWLVKQLKQDYPEQYQNILTENDKQAPLIVRTNHITRDALQEKFSEQGINSEAVGPEALALQKAQAVESLPGFAEGWFTVQDLSGQFAAHLLDLHANQHILDACAAPGSKTTHILSLTPTPSTLVALDISASRLKRLEENISRLQLPTSQIEVGDAATHTFPHHFDRILVDAPCSSTGVIRRHPDIKHLRQASDITTLADNQLAILSHLWSSLAPGGKLLYSTCSLLKQENDHVIKAFLASHSDATLNKVNLPIGHASSFGWQILPGKGDGFFYALLSKKHTQTN